jgi:hypothetical protein
MNAQSENRHRQRKHNAPAFIWHVVCVDDRRVVRQSSVLPPPHQVSIDRAERAHPTRTRVDEIRQLSAGGKLLVERKTERVRLARRAASKAGLPQKWFSSYHKTFFIHGCRVPRADPNADSSPENVRC